jgi:DNA-binding beta-propeller fold protein YncE
MPLLLLVLLLAQAIPANASIDEAVFIAQWGQRTPLGPGTLNIPIANAVDDATGDVYTTESFRVEKWDALGNFLLEWRCNCLGIGVNSVTHDVYVSLANDRIAQYTSSGALVRTWGSSGTGPGQFDLPFGVSVDSTTGNVYVHDSGNARVQVFDATGGFIREFTDPWLGRSADPGGVAFDPNARVVWVTDPSNNVVVKFDEVGNYMLHLGTGQPLNQLGSFRWPRSVAVDSQSRVFVTDTDSERIQYFGSDGSLLGAFQGPNNREDGPFHPRDLAINRSNDAKYVLAAYASRVDRFDASNGFEFYFGGHQRHGPVFQFPGGIAASPITGDVYVFDAANFLIKRATAGGAIVSSFGGSIRISLTEPGLFGSFISSALTIDALGNLWTGLVAIHYADDPDAMFIQKFDADMNHLLSLYRTSMSGQFYFERVRQIEVEPQSGHIWIADSRFNKAQKFDSAGNKLLEIGGVGTPSGIAFGDHVYIADRTGHMVHKYESNGSFVTNWGSFGSGDGQFSLTDMSGVTVGPAGNVYVADTFNSRIQQFGPDGSFMGKLGVQGTGVGQLLYPVDIAFSPDGKVMHVVDRGNHRISSFCMSAADLGVCLAQMDEDSDGFLDAADVCPFTADPLQDDTGGVNTPTPDGIGDACQCGEVTDDGMVDAADLASVRAVLAGLGTPTASDRCSVSGDAACDALDMVVLSRALAGLEPSLQQVCAPAVR